MVKEISVNKKEKLTPNPSGKKQANRIKRPPLFRLPNYILMVVGVVILAVGYICISGGAAPEPDQFNPEVFNTRRIVVAPILILAGLVIEIFAIMWHPKQKNQEENNSEQNA